MAASLPSPGAPLLTSAEFRTWCAHTAPELSRPLQAVLEGRLLSSNNDAMSPLPSLPTLSGESALLTGPALFALRCASGLLGAEPRWERLYSSSVDGTGFEHLAQGVLGYAGPTVLLVQASHDTLLTRHCTHVTDTSLTRH